MLEYFLLDWQDFDLPVYPIAVLSHKKRAAACQLPRRLAEQARPAFRIRVEVLSEALLDFTSRADLARWRRENSK